MSAWSHNPFGNDDASDWANKLTNSEDLSVILEALDNIIEQGSEYLEAPDASEGIAAIEVIAKLLGNGTQTDSYTEEIDTWVATTKLKPNSKILKKAQKVIDRILGEDSELLELWSDSDDFEKWKKSIMNLRGIVTS